MKVLLLTSKPPLLLISTKHSTSNSQPHLSFTHSSSISPNRRHPPPLDPWKLHAKAKGFAGPPRPPGNPRPTSGRPDTSKSNYDDGEDDDQIPQAVFGRMIGRILAFVGVPMAAGIALLNVFGALKERELLDVPRWLPFLTTLLCFGASALGIAYGTLSSSWDPDKSGSVLGLDEAQRNWAEIWKEEEQT